MSFFAVIIVVTVIVYKC